MRTNIKIDVGSMAEGMEAFGVRTKQEAVERALLDAGHDHRQQKALDGLLGTWLGRRS